MDNASEKIDTPAHGPEARVTSSVSSATSSIRFEAPEFTRLSATTPIEEQSVAPIDNPDRFASLQSIQKEDLGAWIERLRDAKIHADRHASPDVLGQLSEAAKRPVDTVLCSILDSDPTVCLGAALARQFLQEVVAGTVLLSRLVGAKQTAICVDQRVPSSWWAGIRALIRKTPTRLIPMVNDYPQADPTLLLYTLLNRRLRPHQSPVDEHVIVLDAAAAYSIGRRVLGDESMTHVPLAVRDHARKLSHFMMAPLGMNVGELLAHLGEVDTDTLIRRGDLLRDLTLTRADAISAGELIIHTSDPEPEINPDACIRCGWCTEACPTRVQPAAVLESAQRDDIDLADRAGIDACIECGICSYVCPSKLPLLDGIRVMKKRHGM